MRGAHGLRCGACVLAALLLYLARPLAFAVLQPGRRAPPPSSSLQRGAPASDLVLGAARQLGSVIAQKDPLLSLCGAAAAAAAGLMCAARGLRVAMRSQGQGGRFNLGQYYMPKLKGAKKMAVLRKRKNYGTHGARKVPRRYPLYDILEELDETTPTYTVISEPEEPMDPVEDVPLLQRYPWAGSLAKVPKEKQDMEKGAEGMEPYFGSWTGRGMPPMGRRQQYVFRRGVPRYNHPPWLNKPLIGTEVRVPGDMPYKKDRRPLESQLSERQKRLRAQERAADKGKDEVMMEMGEDLDAELDAMSGGD